MVLVRGVGAWQEIPPQKKILFKLRLPPLINHKHKFMTHQKYRKRKLEGIGGTNRKPAIYTRVGHLLRERFGSQSRSSVVIITISSILAHVSFT